MQAEDPDEGSSLGERSTRFDDMVDAPPPKRRAPRRSVNSAVIYAGRALDSVLDRAVVSATAAVLSEDPTSLQEARSRGEVVGIVERNDTDITLRLRDEKGPVFASFRAPRLEIQPCWSTLWQPEWLPSPSAGTGMGIRGESQFVWWRFDAKDDYPFLVRFDPDGVVIWRPDPKDECYRGESLLGLIAGGLSIEEYLSPVSPTDGASPDETEETEGTKPLRIDILPPRGKEEITARSGVVELRTAQKKQIQRWKTTLKGGAACTRAAYHRFLGDPVQVYFEIEFSDDDACDEGAAKREVQQSLFELRSGELVPVVSGSASAGTTDAGEVTTAIELDVRVPTGDGRLRYVGRGGSRQNEVGGDDSFDCAPWAVDQGYDVAETGFAESQYDGQWTFVLEDEVVEIGPVKSMARTYSCHEAVPD